VQVSPWRRCSRNDRARAHQCRDCIHANDEFNWSSLLCLCLPHHVMVSVSYVLNWSVDWTLTLPFNELIALYACVYMKHLLIFIKSPFGPVILCLESICLHSWLPVYFISHIRTYSRLDVRVETCRHLWFSCVSQSGCLLFYTGQNACQSSTKFSTFLEITDTLSSSSVGQWLHHCQ